MKPRVLLFSLPPSGGDLFPISLGYIAAALARRNIHTALAEVNTLSSRTGQEIANFVIPFNPQVVGFSVYQANIRLAVQLARFVKMIDPGILTVIGGPQATFMPKEALGQMPAVDVIVRGEGEVVLPQLVRSFVDDQDCSHIGGIVFRHGRRIWETPAAPLVRNLDAFPSPYKAGSFELSQHSVATMLSSRGCCFNCSFCYTPNAFKRTIRAHSVRRILDDIDICVRHGIGKFFFADPSFTYDRERTVRLMNGIIRRGYKVKIWCETRTDMVDERLLTLMARAGVNRIAYGLESCDPTVNAAIRKRLDLAQFERIVKITQEKGIYPEVFTLYGLPHQTPESCLRTLDCLKKLGIELVGNSSGQQLVLFFGTDIARHPRKYGIKPYETKRPLYLSAGADFVTSCMSRRDIAMVSRRYRSSAGKKQSAGDQNCVGLVTA